MRALRFFALVKACGADADQALLQQTPGPGLTAMSAETAASLPVCARATLKIEA